MVSTNHASRKVNRRWRLDVTGKARDYIVTEGDVMLPMLPAHVAG